MPIKESEKEEDLVVHVAAAAIMMDSAFLENRIEKIQAFQEIQTMIHIEATLEVH